MTRSITRWILTAVLAVTTFGPIYADDAKPKKEDEKKTAATEAKKAAASADDVLKVKAERLKIEVELKGTFEAARAREVVVKPLKWAAPVLKKVVAQGKRVMKGDPLIWFDTEKLVEQIEGLKRDRQVSIITLKQAELALTQAEESVSTQMAAARRAHKQAAKDYEQYLQVGRAVARKRVAFSLKSAQQRLEGAREELEQLEKMYKADDLTEETEEIILKRTRAAYEAAQFSMELSKIAHQRAVKVELPRKDIAAKETARQAEMAWARAKLSIPASLTTARVGVEKQRIARKKANKNLHELQRDLAASILRSPADGIVFHGKATRGKWTASASVKLIPGATVSPKTVVMTIVQRQPLLVRASIPEKELYQVRRGVKGQAVATGFPNQKFDVRVRSVGNIAISAGNYDCVMVVDAERTTPIMPGMTCSVTLVSYDKAKAITIPAKALFTEDGKSYVYLVGKDDKAVRRNVVVGRRSGEKVEIRGGLRQGDEIRLSKPEEK
jgi:HlyD family secretion protein